jgi:hypothetical protein
MSAHNSIVVTNSLVNTEEAAAAVKIDEASPDTTEKSNYSAKEERELDNLLKREATHW